MSGPYAPFKTPRPSTSLNGGKNYKDRTSSVLSPAPAADSNWRNSSQQPASVPSSSFHGAPSSSSQYGARQGASYGAGGDGFDSLLDTYGLSIGGPPSSSTTRPARPSQTAFEQRPRPAPPRRFPQPPVVQRSDEREQAARAAELRRKQAQEADEVDLEAQQRRFETSERAERIKREGLAAARRASAAAAALAADPPKPRFLSSVDIAFEEKKGRTKPKGKGKGEEARERAKERRARGKDKGKGKQRVELESDIEDSPDDRSPRRKSSSSSSSSRKLGSLRGQFDTAPPPAASPSPSPEVVAEVLPTLKDMIDEERAAERKRLKGKGRAADVEEDEHEVERVEMDVERSLREETDALLDVADDALPDASTLCPFCDRPLPDTPSPQLLATRAALLRLPHGPRPSLRNKAAVRLPEGEHVVRTAAFCKMHVDEREVVPDGRARGYPTRIQWDELPRRINRQLDTHLSDVILGKATSPFLDRARSAWEAGEWKSVLSEYGSFDVEEPGYYGPRGLELIKHTLSRLFVDEMALITPRRIAPLSIDFYLRRVLVPECAVELIRADLAASAAPPARRDGETLRAQAERVRVESRAYGRAVFPHEAEAEERREAAAATAPTQGARPSGAAVADGAQGKKGGRSRDERGREHEAARPAKKRKRASSSSSSSSEESDGIEVVERARAPTSAPARVPKVVAAPPVRAPTTGGGFRVPKAQAQARSAAPSTSSSASAGAAAAAASATSGRKGVAAQDDSDSDDELVIVSAPPFASSPGKKVKKDKKKKQEKERKHTDKDRDQERKQHKKVRRSSPASSPALGLFPPTSSRPSSSLALDSSPPTRQTDLDRLVAALDPAAEDELAEVEFKAGSFARENRRREAREKKERREKKKRERARKKVRGGRASSSSSSDEA
ncbi:hypothetical protein JCM9279_005954 [Rhodotorula babjevae]